MGPMKKIDLAISILIIACFFFLFKLTTNQIFSFDAITNAIACESGEPARWFHSNHLLYPFLGVLYYKLEWLLGYRGFSIYSLARFNSLLVSIALGILYLHLSLIVERYLSLLSVLFLGSTYSVWNYAVDGRAIGASVFFAVLVIIQLHRMIEMKSISFKNLLLLGFLSVLYTLCHGIGVFHVIPIAWWLFKQNDRGTQTGMVYLAIVGGCVGAAYGLVYFWVTYPFAKIPFLTWAVGYAGHQGGNKILESHFWVKDILSALRGIWMGWKNSFVGPFLLETSIRKILATFFACLFALIILGGVFLVKNQEPRMKSFVQILFVWGGLAMVFLIFWSPGQEGFRLHAIIPWLVACVLIIPHSRIFKWGLGLSSFFLFVLNFSGPLSYAATIKNNTGYQLLSGLNQHLKPGDLFLCGKGSFLPNVEVLLPYFFPQMKGGSLEGRLFAFNENSLEPLEQSLAKQRNEGHNIYVGSDLLDPLIQQSIEERFGLEHGVLKNFVDRLKLKEAFLLSTGREIYVVTHS
jgi:hypothetical protein